MTKKIINAPEIDYSLQSNFLKCWFASLDYIRYDYKGGVERVIKSALIKTHLSDTIRITDNDWKDLTG